MMEIRMEDVGAYFDQVEALEAELRSLRGVVQAVHELLVEIVTGVGIASEATRGEVNFTVEAARLIADRLRAALAAAADAPQPGQRWERADDEPFPQTSTHTRPTPQADRRLAELTRLGVLHPDKDDQPGPSPAVLPEKEQQ